MRTADRLLAGDWAFPVDPLFSSTKAGIGNAQWLAEVCDTLKASPVVVADNVARYVDETAGSGTLALEGYPSLAPPWPTWWCEYPSSSGVTRRGVLVADVTELTWLPDGDRSHLGMLACGAKDNAGDTEVRWVVAYVLLVEQQRKVWGPAGTVCLALDGAGQVVGNRWEITPIEMLGERIKTVRTDDERTPEMEERVRQARGKLTVAVGHDVGEHLEHLPGAGELRRMNPGQQGRIHDALVAMGEAVEAVLAAKRSSFQDLTMAMAAAQTLTELDAIGTLDDFMADMGAGTATDANRSFWLMRALKPAWQTTAFLHCANMRLDEQNTPGPVQARRRRKGHLPLVRYHTLRLEVPRRAGGKGSGAGTGDLTAVHIVAGHFSHYGACCTNHDPRGLLFGKLTGVYWVPSHARGSTERGMVRTDFEVAEVDA